VDLGANIGYYALMEAKGIGPTGKVHAIEPAPENYELLVRNVELNGFGDIISTHCLAIGDRRGMVPMTLSHAMNRHTFLSIESASIKKTLDVPMITFSDFVDEHGVDLEKLALVRMDIEGIEAKVLPGIAEVLRGRCGVNLQVEFHPTQIDSHPDCSFRETLQVLQTLTDRFEWLLARKGHRKIMLRNISIDDVLASEMLMSQNNFESWLTVRRN
jgi:FkbM family methyltransferase